VLNARLRALDTAKHLLPHDRDGSRSFERITEFVFSIARRIRQIAHDQQAECVRIKALPR